ncbi:MAG: hypothetical protein ACOCQD_01045 [archaeon]
MSHPDINKEMKNFRKLFTGWACIVGFVALSFIGFLFFVAWLLYDLLSNMS